MKQTQQQLLIQLFRRNNYQLTLGQIIAEPYGYEFRARFAELRKLAYKIDCERHPTTASLNVYRMREPMPKIQMDLFPIPQRHTMAAH